MKKILLPLSLLVLILSSPLKAQFSLDGQIIQRSEYRHGYNRLIAEDENAAFFIAHRLRLQAEYVLDSFTFYASMQDVRPWGAVPQAKPTDPFISLHEGWAEVAVHRNWRVKLGRQELNYNNARFLGNLDWALQARAHDFALVKYEEEDFKLHFGAGYNQDAQTLTGTIFTTANQYKSAQLLWAEKEWSNFTLAFLGWNDGRQYVDIDTVGNVVDEGQYFRQTLGFSAIKFDWGKTLLSGFYYHQLGRDPAGREVNAWDISAQITQTLFTTEKGHPWKATAGFEILSGNDMTAAGNENNAFAPLYGTNHIHNGYMDYFYVGGAWNNSVGLQDYYLKLRSRFSSKFFTQVDGHFFMAQASPVELLPSGSVEELDKYLGTEIDLSFAYLFHPAVSVQLGYSQMFASDTFEYLNGGGDFQETQNWAYLMLIFRPTMKNKNIGIYQ